jgi:ubiquinone biosynthesis protein
MVVVEGVARSFNPHINIWRVAQPIVEDYIRQHIGPKAIARDLSRTARVLARFGPRLPVLAEAALIRQSHPVPVRPRRRDAMMPLAHMAIGGGLVALGVWLGAWFGAGL